MKKIIVFFTLLSAASLASFGQNYTTFGIGTSSPVGTLHVRLMEKVEELTLHVIELQKQIDELKEEGGRK